MNRSIITAKLNRRDMLRFGMAGTAAGIAGLTLRPLAPADAQIGGPESTQTAELYQLQAAFHRAKSTQDLDLMMSLWADDGTLNVQGDPHSPYVGSQSLRSFWQSSGSFTQLRFSLVPSFKIQIDVHGDQAWLYFECHDIGDFDLATRFIASDTFLAGTVRHVGGNWLFWEMAAGKSSPLSVDHSYFP
jgi:hypothetical protein